MRKGELSDVGKIRPHNEDSYFSFGNDLYCYGIVADGMGGHLAGEVASGIAVHEISEYIRQNMNAGLNYVEASEVIRHAFIAANTVIYNYAEKNLKVMGMGTTATLAMVYRDKLITANVGDSRIYIINDKCIKQITRDHSYVAELVARGEITPEQAKHHPKKNYITRAMGTEETVKVDIEIKDYNKETVLICSDGLSNMVSDSEMFDMVRNRKNLKRCAQKLVKTANMRGGTDNITVIIYRKDR